MPKSRNSSWSAAPPEEPRGADDAAEAGRLRWLCRRGMQELDVLLAAFLEVQYTEAPAHVRAAFRRLLDEPDDRLWHWLSGQALPEEEALRDVVERIRHSAAT